MKKIILVFLLLALVFLPGLSFAKEETIVQCGNGNPSDPGFRPCGIGDFFGMLVRIFNFIVKWIASPLAIIMLTIGAVMLMASAGNPGLAGLGKKTMGAAIIGLILVWGAYLIIDFILKAIGYTGNWKTLY